MANEIQRDFSVSVVPAICDACVVPDYVVVEDVAQFQRWVHDGYLKALSISLWHFSDFTGPAETNKLVFNTQVRLLTINRLLYQN